VLRAQLACGRVHAANDGQAPCTAQVVSAVVQALEQLEDAKVENLDVEAVNTLEETMARMTRLYAENEQLDLAIETSRESPKRIRTESMLVTFMYRRASKLAR